MHISIYTNINIYIYIFLGMVPQRPWYGTILLLLLLLLLLLRIILLILPLPLPVPLCLQKASTVKVVFQCLVPKSRFNFGCHPPCLRAYQLQKMTRFRMPYDFSTRFTRTRYYKSMSI